MAWQPLAIGRFLFISDEPISPYISYFYGQLIFPGLEQTLGNLYPPGRRLEHAEVLLIEKYMRQGFDDTDVEAETGTC